MIGAALGRAPAQRKTLLCLGVLEPELPAGHALAGEAGWLRPARRLLDHARAHGWTVAHVFSAEQHGRMSAWRPPAGLRPLPCEPVFYRPAVSAFSSLDLDAFCDDRPGDLLLLFGASLDACCLTTAVNGLRGGRDLVVAQDALLAPTEEFEGLAALESVSGQCGLGRVRLETSSRMTGRMPYIRVIRGGRA
jgi:nicotinamidase-related amidase